MADGAAEVCICILFYGAEEQHFKLAQRVLNEPMRCLAKRNIEFRFGCNAVGAATTDFLLCQIAEHFQNATLFHSPENILKYPMMRRMFHESPIRPPITMWFDHDSYLKPGIDVDDWLRRVVKHFDGCDMVGSVQKSKLTDDQVEWAKPQWWFTDSDKTYMSYAIGGWWAVKTDLLRRYDWPAEDFQQKGGDVVLGALLKHQERCLCHFREGVHVNANEAGVEAAAARTIES